MNINSRIYLAGHTGLVGSALLRTLKAKGYKNIIVRTLDQLDLTSQKAVEAFYKAEKPEYVLLAAAKVGGIVANNTYRADFIYENLMIQNNVIHASWKHEVKKLLFLGSTCIYPSNAPQPMKEEYILSGRLEQTNEPYAIAKIAGLKMCESYNRQYGTDFIAVMPTNLYGPGDNFDLEKSHVLPAILRKMHLAASLERNNWDAIRLDLDRYPIEQISGKSGEEEILAILDKYGIKNDSRLTTHNTRHTHQYLQNEPQETSNGKHLSVTLWGTGTPLREFMYSEEMAAACIFIMENISGSDIVKLNGGKPDAPQFVNIGTGIETTISDLASLIAGITGFKGKILFDISKPDGTMRKLTDITVLSSLGFSSKVGVEEGIRWMYESYLR